MTHKLGKYINYTIVNKYTFTASVLYVGSNVIKGQQKKIFCKLNVRWYFNDLWIEFEFYIQQDDVYIAL